jgi:hypothetical protein
MKKTMAHVARLTRLSSSRQAAATGGIISVLALTAGVAYAVIRPTPFAGIVPRIGSITFPTSYVTTTDQRDIRVQMSENPYELVIKPVKCNGGDISTYKTIPANSRQAYTIATNVRDGTCFKLNVAADTFNYFDILGKVNY